MAARQSDNGTIYLEILANPTNRVADLPAIRAAAAVILVDATFTTSVCFRASSGKTATGRKRLAFRGTRPSITPPC